VQHSGMRDGANRAFVTGKSRIVGVDVICLDEADKTHEQHTEEGQSPEPCGAVVC
jgi:hypothetical protein